jgi:hypothetical protein
MIKMSMAVDRLDNRTGNAAILVMMSVRMKYFFLSSSVRMRANWSAMTMMSDSLVNSDGWKVKPAMRIHRAAPLRVTTSGLPGIKVE